MTAVLVAVTILTAVANLFSAVLDFLRFDRILVSMTRAGVPHTWLPWLGVLKAAGAAGLLVGLAVPWAGVAAAVGLVGFFVLAIATHLRARDYALGLPASFLALAAGTLVLALVQPG